jgi:hypothetical protein
MLCHSFLFPLLGMKLRAMLLIDMFTSYAELLFRGLRKVYGCMAMLVLDQIKYAYFQLVMQTL